MTTFWKINDFEGEPMYINPDDICEVRVNLSSVTIRFRNNISGDYPADEILPFLDAFSHELCGVELTTAAMDEIVADRIWNGPDFMEKRKYEGADGPDDSGLEGSADDEH